MEQGEPDQLIPRELLHPKLSSVLLEIKSEENVWVCTCGQSKNQPYCDGSHKSTKFTPLKLQGKDCNTYLMCQCGYSNDFPICDNSHIYLTAEEKETIRNKAKEYMEKMGKTETQEKEIKSLIKEEKIENSTSKESISWLKKNWISLTGTFVAVSAIVIYYTTKRR